MLRKSSQEVLERLYKYIPDLVIVDFVLEDINGGSLCHQIKCDKRFSNLPLALLTEYDNLENLLPKFGCSYLLNKPLGFNEMAFLVENVLQTENAE